MSTLNQQNLSNFIIFFRQPKDELTDKVCGVWIQHTTVLVKEVNKVLYEMNMMPQVALLVQFYIIKSNIIYLSVSEQVK